MRDRYPYAPFAGPPHHGPLERKTEPKDEGRV